MKIVSATEMREIDRLTSERFGVPSLILMENAGTAVADFVLRAYSSAHTIGIICGKGNNGGDGFVVARKLHEAGKKVLLAILGEPSNLTGDAAEMFKRVPNAGIVVRSGEDLAQNGLDEVFRADVLVDAILGTGFRPPVRGLYAEAIQRTNAATCPVVAVDISSGADADAMGQQTGVVARADAIVTFTSPRPAHVFGMLTTGPTIIAPIGSPNEAVTSELQLNLITAVDVATFLAPRRADANKGSFGHVLTVGGSLGKSGAAAMAGMSALRVGAGLSTVATAKSVLSTVAGFHPELMTEPLEETESGTISMRALEYGRFDSLIKGKTVLAVGPGISRNRDTVDFVHAIVNKYEIPVIIDADGLNAFAGHIDQLSGKTHPCVITPHPGEMARLAACSVPEVQRDRLGVARKFAREHELIVILKGHRTLVASPSGEAWVNTSGNPGMATGGTGDILTGMIAGFVAQHPENIFQACLAAVHLHGVAGDVARKYVGEHSLVATDLLGHLPEAFRTVQDCVCLPSTQLRG